MENTQKPAKVVDSGFDYLTLTAKPQHENFQQFNGCALDFISAMETAGCKVEESSQGGYDGFKAGETFWGKRHDSAIWRTSGSLSRNVAEFVRFNAITPRVTRADLQQTLEQPDGDTRELERILRAFRRRMARNQAPKRSKFATFHDAGLPIGSTFGARSSAEYLRCYRADLRHPEKFSLPALRFEAEWKDVRAQQIWAAFEAVQNDVTLSSAFVGGAFSKKGITQPVCADVAPCLLPPIGRTGSDQKTVYWIQNTVCKIIARLVKAGYLDDLAEHVVAALTPIPDVRERCGTLGSEIQEIDWELIENGRYSEG